MEKYQIDIVGLSNKVHHFEYKVDNAFFHQYGSNLVDEGTFEVNVDLEKHETFIEVKFTIEGNAILTCDRSLEKFEYPLKTTKTVVFKYGEEEKEIDDDVYMITHNTQNLTLGQLIYELIGIAIPMKKLHPKYQEVDSGEDEIIYSSNTSTDSEIDPRWEKLKKLK